MIFNKLIPIDANGEIYSKTIDHSCRFNDDDSAYLNYTQAAGSRRKWTVSLWIKRCNISVVEMPLFYGNSVYEFLRFESGDTIMAGFNGYNKSFTPAYRDPTSWMHILWAVDTDQATAANRSRLYINGVEVTGYSGSDPPLNNDAVDIGVASAVIYLAKKGSQAAYGDFYLAEPYFIDGSQLTPSDFGEFKYNIWIPKDYSTPVAGNNCKLDFENSADLGNDISGNANDWTPSGLTTADQVEDSPTNNHPTLNVLHELATATLANGNLDCSGTENEYATITIPSSGKWGWKITTAEAGSFGLEDIDGNEEVAADLISEVVEMLVDMDAGTLKKKVDGGSLETIQATLNTSAEWYPHFKAACSVDFGQLGYSPTESGYKTLCSDNLDNPTIEDCSKGVVTAKDTGANIAATLAAARSGWASRIGRLGPGKAGRKKRCGGRFWFKNFWLGRRNLLRTEIKILSSDLRHM